MSTSICNECAKNHYLKKRITSEGEYGVCRICRKHRPRTFDYTQLSGLLAGVIRQNFASGALLIHSVIENGTLIQKAAEPYGLPLASVVKAILDQDLPSDFIDGIIRNIIFTNENGHDPFFSKELLYVVPDQDSSVDHMGKRWSLLIDELKYRRRFFSESVRAFFDGLFRDIEGIKTWSDSAETVCTVIRDMAHGMCVFRARAIESEELEQVIQKPFNLVGPPPRVKARTGRMNPEGIVALYCAMDTETAVAELRPAIGKVHAVISMSFTRQLRLLDFERLERSLDDGLGALLDPNLDATRMTRKFLRKLHELISQPVVPGHEADYLITQTMAEYLAHIHKPQIDGIMFKSVQSARGINVVLFPEQNPLDLSMDSFPVEYVPESLTFFRTSEVEYKHSPLFPATSSINGVNLYANEDLKALNK